jgi:hypothetical protein
MGMLDVVKEIPSQRSIISGLKNANEFEGVYAELQVASRLKTNDLWN